MRRRDEAKFQELIQVIARGGQTIQDWCQSSGVKYQTAREWACLPEFREEAAKIHQAALDAYVSKLTSEAGTIAKKLLELADKGERSQIVQLQACRAVIADALAVRESTNRDQQIAELIKRIENLEGNQSSG